jgi:dihydropteroate synthase
MKKIFDIKLIKFTKKQLAEIGFDKSYINKGTQKHIFKSIKINNLTCAQANILKQTAISVGIDCAVHREVITGKVELSDCILSGSENQIIKVAEKLQKQPFKLKTLGEQLAKILTTQLTPLTIRKKEMDWNSTILMGILNVTPDSFSDGGQYNTIENALQHFEKLKNDGADIIDIGGESTRPNAEIINPEEEISRTIKVIEEIRKNDTDTIISIDTRNAITARKALMAGADIINDISGLEWDEKMIEVIKEHQCPIIITHSNQTTKEKDIVDEILNFFETKIDYLTDNGIKTENIILDVGIGFQKDFDDNLEIIKRINEFKTLNYPIMVGHSRKRFLQSIINTQNNDSLDDATLIVSHQLINEGVNILRIHNVKNHKTMKNITNILKV